MLGRSSQERVNREAAISVIPEAIRGDHPRFQRARVISKWANAFAQRGPRICSVAMIRARFIDVHAIDSELPLHRVASHRGESRME